MLKHIFTQKPNFFMNSMSGHTTEIRNSDVFSLRRAQTILSLLPIRKIRGHVTFKQFTVIRDEQMHQFM